MVVVFALFVFMLALLCFCVAIVFSMNIRRIAHAKWQDWQLIKK